MISFYQKMIRLCLPFLICGSSAFAGKLDGADSLFFQDSRLKNNIQALKSKGITNVRQLPPQTIPASEGTLNALIKRIHPQSATLTQALAQLTDGSQNALTDLTPGNNQIQRAIDSYRFLYAQAVEENGGFDPKDFGIDVDITEGIHPSPQSLSETNASLLGLLRNFFTKRKKLFQNPPADFKTDNLGSFMYFMTNWDFYFKNHENQDVHFYLNTGYFSSYTADGYVGDPEKEILTISDVLGLCFHTPETNNRFKNDSLSTLFLRLIQKKEQKIQEKFFKIKESCHLQKQAFLKMSESEKKAVLQRLKNETEKCSYPE
jgi:hypothetical protein